MRRAGPGRRKPAEVDDAGDAGGPRLLGERGRPGAFLLLEPAGRAQRVHQVVRGVDTREPAGQGLAIQHVAAHDLRGAGGARREGVRTSREAADANAAFLQPVQQPAAHVPGGARQEHQFRL